MENNKNSLDKKAKKNRIIQMVLGICIPTIVASGVSAGITYAIASKQLKLPSYTVTFKNWDGTILQQSKVQIGSDAKYNGEEPKKETTDYVDYKFTGWDKELTNIISDREITAQFEGTRQTYTMTWYDDDGTTPIDTKTCYKDEIAKGEYPTTDKKPTKKTSEGTQYSFANWKYDEGEGWKTGNFKATAVYDEAKEGLVITDGVIVSYTGDEKDLEIPTSWEGKPVTTIGTDAFNVSSTNATAITSITIPNSITNIEMAAFRNATSLKTVTFNQGSTITDIKEGTFYGCSALQTFTIPDSIINVNNMAFYNCTSLTELTFGAGITRDGFNSGSLDGCTALTNFKVSENNQAFTTIEGYDGFIFSKDKTVLIRCCPSNAFSGTLPQSIVVVTSMAFQGCTNIGVVSFTNCPNLRVIDDRAFAGSSITEFESGDSITTFGSDVFVQCNNLTKITLGKTVSLDGGWDSFSGCSSLKELNVSSENEYMESHNGMIYDKKDTENHQLLRCPLACEVMASGQTTIWDQCKKIGNSAFQGCLKLTEYEVPNFIEVIDDYAFGQCPNLTKITVGKGTIKSLGAEIFGSCSALKTLVIGSGIGFTSTLNADVWSGCQSIESIEVDASNTMFKAIDGVLYATDQTDAWLLRYPPAKSGANFAIPSTVEINGITYNVKYLGRMCFSLVNQLETITIPNTVTNIYDYAFKNCAKLTTLDLSSGCQLSDDCVADHILSGCSNFSTLNLYTATESDKTLVWLFSKRFDYTPLTVKFSLSTTSIPANAFKSSTSIKKIIIDNGPTTIESNAFSYCENLEEVELPSTITNIAGWAFARDSKLTKINLPDNLTTIGYNAFEYCAKWTNIEFPSKLTTVTSSAFMGCGGNEHLDLTKTNITAIQNFGFAAMVKLVKVTIPKQITMQEQSFKACSSLTTVIYSGTIDEFHTNIATSGNEFKFFNECDKVREITCTDGTIPRT